MEVKDGTLRVRVVPAQPCIGVYPRLSALPPDLSLRRACRLSVPVPVRARSDRRPVQEDQLRGGVHRRGARAGPGPGAAAWIPPPSPCWPSRPWWTSPTCCGPGTWHSCATSSTTRSLGQRPLRGPGAAEERQHRRQRACYPAARTPAPPPSSGYKGENVFTFGDDERALARGVFDAYGEKNLRYSQMAPLDMYTEKNTGSNLPAQIDLYAAARRRLQVPVPGQGRRLGQQDLPVPGDQGAAEPGVAAEVRGRQGARHRHLGLPALPPGAGHRRPVGRDDPEDGEAGQRPLPRRPAHHRQRPGARLPRRGSGGPGAGDLPPDRHRRPVRRQVLRPRRAGHPPAPPWGLLPGGPGGVLLGRPPGAGQDHPRRRLPRRAGDQPRPLPARGDRTTIWAARW